VVYVERRSLTPAPGVAARSTGRARLRRDDVALAGVVDTIIDRGVVIDADARATLLLIDFDIDAQAFVASIDTYLRVALAAGQRAGEDRRRPRRRRD
jgi:hypothetical protein